MKMWFYDLVRRVRCVKRNFGKQRWVSVKGKLPVKKMSWFVWEIQLADLSRNVREFWQKQQTSKLKLKNWLNLTSCNLYIPSKMCLLQYPHFKTRQITHKDHLLKSQIKIHIQCLHYPYKILQIDRFQNWKLKGKQESQIHPNEEKSPWTKERD